MQEASKRAENVIPSPIWWLRNRSTGAFFAKKKAPALWIYLQELLHIVWIWFLIPLKICLHTFHFLEPWRISSPISSPVGLQKSRLRVSESIQKVYIFFKNPRNLDFWNPAGLEIGLEIRHGSRKWKVWRSILSGIKNHIHTMCRTSWR